MRPGVLAVAVAGIVAAAPARADAEIETRVSARKVEVGEPFRLQMSVLAGGGEKVSSPRLAPPPGIAIEGPSVSTQSQVTIANGRMIQQTGISATWTLLASRPGVFRIGPPSVEVDGRLQRGEVVVVEVVPEGTGGRARRPQRRAPFDPFGMWRHFDPFGGQRFPQFPLDDPLQDLPPVPEELQTSRALDPLAFLIAKAKPTRVVLGQQVSLTIYAYGARGDFQGLGSTEPSREGFLAYEMKPDERSYLVPIDGKVFTAKQVHALALFPIRTGTLRIGPASFGFLGGGYPRSRQGIGLLRESQPLEVVVVEPPLDGRPPGYRLGDVGRYTLTASVEPRRVRQGDAVSVVAKLEGTGNLPPTLVLPRQRGVEWLEPSTTEQIDAERGALGGQRTFTYVVKLDQPGKLDLGELTLPYYDPERRRYDIAKAVLGTVDVTPNPQAKSNEPSAMDPLAGLLPPRVTPGPEASSRTYWADARAFWLALVLAPLSVLSASGVRSLAGRFAARRRERTSSPEQRASRELDLARRALAHDPKAAIASAERSVLLAIENATGIKARGLLRSELERELLARGLPEALARGIVAVLDAAERARFVGGAREIAPELVLRAQQIVAYTRRGRRQ